MLIVGQKVLDENLLLDADASRISNATYYLTVDRITRGDDEKELSDVTIGPNEIVWVVSKERFNLKGNDKIALVSLKSSLTKQGLLALDTGFVDPRFEGPIGTVIVNFSKNQVHLSKGDEFFRVIFIHHEELKSPFIDRKMPTYKDSEEYVAERKKEIVRDYKTSFLSLETLSEEIKSEVISDAANRLKGDLLAFIFKKYWGRITVVLLLLFAFLGVMSYFGSSLFTKEEMKEIIKDQLSSNEAPS